MRFRRWTRPNLQQTSDAEGTRFGIGVPVHVVDGLTGDSFADEPTGLIVGTGTILPHRGVTTQSVQARVWIVQFDEPQHLRDGRGPFSRAEISEESLVAAPPLDDEPDQARGTTTPFS
ncbi:hypothetical protein [Paramicrobacterium agarici]|uniref:hypothetical protein n=1 Tax=Paramicrobacterium agarici TaxID=630514 RepID=UPI0011510935|nr:hypothetical protein [Microbacterium agarici]TQO23321.1 hypothetical protein FB385_2171 [Microbacterium agarici]